MINPKNMGKMMKQAQQMQKQMAEVQQKLSEIEIIKQIFIYQKLK